MDITPLIPFSMNYAIWKILIQPWHHIFILMMSFFQKSATLIIHFPLQNTKYKITIELLYYTYIAINDKKIMNTNMIFLASCTYAIILKK